MRWIKHRRSNAEWEAHVNVGGDWLVVECRCPLWRVWLDRAKEILGR